MPIKTHTDLLGAIYTNAGVTVPQGAIVYPSGSVAAAPAGPALPSAVSSTTTGRPLGMGIDISKAHSLVLGSGLQADADPTAAVYQNSSPFPYSGLDSFIAVTNDTGQIAKASAFNSLSNAVRAMEQYLSRILKAAPGDLSDRLHGRTLNATTGIAPNAVTHRGITGGTRYSSGDTSVTAPVRSPILVTVGCAMTVTGWLSYKSSGVLTLTSAQKTALGLTGTVSGIKGIAFFTGCKFQAPSVGTFGSSDPRTWDAAALNGRVSARIDETGDLELFLSPGSHISSTTSAPAFFSHSPGNLPYLAPGIWYVWVTLVRSAYTWP